MSKSAHIPTTVLAFLGVFFIVASGMRGGIPLLAWVAPVPWLLWIRRARHWRHRGVVLLVLTLATLAQLAKIVAPPIDLFFVLGLGLPAAMGSWSLLLLWDYLRRHTSEIWSLYAWPALVALSEWSNYAAGPMGVWGTGASTQPDTLLLLQLASLFGVAAIGALMAWVAAFVAASITEPAHRWRYHGACLGTVLVAVFVFGAWRLDRPSHGPTVRVAAVIGDLWLGSGVLPSASELDANLERLFERSAQAAEAGARLIAWNEGATVLQRHEEADLLARASAFAREHGVDLVIAYVVPTPASAYRFENVAVFVDADGIRRARYHKRHPLPGEAEPSTNPVPRIVRPYGAVSMAICYDHDFPDVARAHAASGADLVVVPASDWRGIDPLHGKLARVRAIEGGFSSLRPTIGAASAAYDPMGRIRGWMRFDEQNSRVLLVDLPVTRRLTLYSAVGDVPVVVGASLYLLVLLGVALHRRRRTTLES